MGRSTHFLDRIRCRRPMIVYGDGQSLWSAGHSRDVAQGFLAAAGNEKAFGRAYNGAGSEWMTWIQYLQKIACVLEAPMPDIIPVPTAVLAKMLPERTGQCQRSFQYPGIYDISAAQRDLGYHPEISFLEGIRENIAWLDRNGMIEPWAEDPQYDETLDRWREISGRLQSAPQGAQRGADL